MISIISALAKNRAIGKKNALPWYLPADLKHFKENTTGKTVVMGLNTFRSVGEKPFPNRKIVVLTDQADYQAPEGVVLARSIDEVLKLTKNDGEVMISGGAMVYQQFLPLADRLYLTFIDHDFDGDIFFPEFNMDEWKEVNRENHQPDDPPPPGAPARHGKNQWPYSFVVLERKATR